MSRRLFLGLNYQADLADVHQMSRWNQGTKFLLVLVGKQCVCVCVDSVRQFRCSIDF